ncbi:hypothetical protein F5Y16DRAFT_423746 [Xylariaceae sp. FL0255]|nr:hypothetical protein F5Y16DRAFT_423746 [Xylariaceae sp. FL0255]
MSISNSQALEPGASGRWVRPQGWIPPHLRDLEEAATQPYKSIGVIEESGPVATHIRPAEKNIPTTEEVIRNHKTDAANTEESLAEDDTTEYIANKKKTVLKTGLKHSRWATHSENTLTMSTNLKRNSATNSTLRASQQPENSKPLTERPDGQVKGSRVASKQVTMNLAPKPEKEMQKSPVAEHTKQVEVPELVTTPQQDPDVNADIWAHDTSPTKRENAVSTMTETQSVANDNLNVVPRTPKSLVAGQKRLVGVGKPLSMDTDSMVKVSNAATMSHTSEGSVDDPIFPIIPNDLRGNWPTTPPDFRDHALRALENQDWNATRQAKKKAPSVSTSDESQRELLPQLMSEYISDWAQKAPVVQADFLNDGGTKGHQHCDVDPLTGALLEPVSYFTIRDPGDPGSSKSLTSEIRMAHFKAEQDAAKKDEERRLARTKAKEEADVALTSSSPADEPEPESNEQGVKIPCHLRPAVQSDMAEVANIYNHEVKNGYKVIDRQPIAENYFSRILKDCQAEQMPFAVAVDGWYMDETTKGPVIGFAMVTAAIRGLGGSFNTMARPGGKLIVIVHPDYRGQKIGTALIDLILAGCSQWHMPLEGYQFVNIVRDRTLMSVMDNPRVWWYLDLEVAIESHKNRVETKCKAEMSKLLDFFELKFKFLLHLHEDKAFYDPKTDKWYDRVQLRHLCRRPGPRQQPGRR